MGNDKLTQQDLERARTIAQEDAQFEQTMKSLQALRAQQHEKKQYFRELLSARYQMGEQDQIDLGTGEIRRIKPTE